MALRDQWPYVVGALAALAGIGLLMARGEPLGVGLPSPGAAATPPPPNGRGQILGSDPIMVFPGMTYFATVETNGSVDAAANEARVKAKAEAEGFRDVVVSKGARIANWPGTIVGDYFVRATFVGKSPKSFPRHVGVFLGSVNLLDAWEA